MKKPFVILAALVLALFTGCQKPQPEPEPEPEGPRTLSAKVEELSPALASFVWSAQDTLAVHADGQGKTVRFNIQRGLGTTSAQFVGTVKGKSLVALSPAVADAGLQGKQLSLTLPATQKYVSGNRLDGHAFPMLAVSETDELVFQSLEAVLVVPISGNATLSRIRIAAASNEMPLSGKATVRTDYSGAPALTMKEANATLVTLECKGVQLKGDVATGLYFVLPPGTYRGGFILEIETYTGTVLCQIEGNPVLERAKIYSAPAITCNEDDTADPDHVPNNQVWYTTLDGKPLTLSEASFNQPLLSHESREDGWHVLRFDGPLTQLGSYAFASPNLADLRLPDSVTALGDRALSSSSLKTFRTPEKLSKLGEHVFSNCQKLTRFEGKWASADNTAIIFEDGTLAAYATGLIHGTVTLPEGAVALADELFERDSDLREVILPEGLVKIGDRAFWNIPLLQQVTLPSSLREVGRHVFAYCTGLTRFQGTSSLIREERSLVDAEGTLLAVAGGGLTDYTLPLSVSVLGSGVFVGLSDLQSITFTRELENLYSDSISDCRKLEFFYGPGATEDHHGLVMYGDYLVLTTTVMPREYTVPDNVRRIFWSVFMDNNTTEHLVIPDAVYYIGKYCFSGMSNLRTLQLPASLQEVGAQAFRYCRNLEHLYMRASVPPLYSQDSESSFFGHSGLVIHVPEGTDMYYKSAIGWADYTSYIQPIIYEDLPETGVYHSTDFSWDGVVSVLQTATEGTGINVVLMGDAFSDRQMANGVYDSVMKHMAETLFQEEPFASYRKLFNVYAVYVVSPSEGYGDKGQALGTWFGEDTEVGGDDTACMAYALKAIPQDAMDNALLVVAMNSARFGGTCSMYAATHGDYGAGMGLAYLPIYHLDSDFDNALCHEAIGHGFAKLADEYASLEGEIPAAKKKEITDRVPYGWWKNVDLTESAQEVKWSAFLQDARYQNSGLGCFEGAYDYKKGVWRPTEQSLMRYTFGGFNAPSRLAIWYKLHRLAYGTSWKYNYEDFVTYDAVNRKSTQSTSSRALTPLPAPRVLPTGWKQVWTKDGGRRQHREQQHRQAAHYVPVADEETASLQ